MNISPADAFQCGRCPLDKRWPGVEAAATYDMWARHRVTNGVAMERVTVGLSPAEREAMAEDFVLIEAATNRVVKAELEAELETRRHRSRIDVPRQHSRYRWRR